MGIRYGTHRILLRALPCLLSLLPVAAAAATVYTWTDNRGVTHFSETPPPDMTVETRRMEIDTPPAMRPPLDDDHFSVINQARRMQQSRLENERARTERLQAEVQARRAAAEARAANRGHDNYNYRQPYYTPLNSFPGYFWGRPGHGPGRPGHLPARPGHQPGRHTVGINTR